MTGLPARGQSHVVGVALLLGITVIALAGLTAGIGNLVGHNAASADAERVADALDDAHAPSETTGTTRTDLPLGGGAIGTESRTIRLFGVDTDDDPPPLDSLDPDDGLDVIKRIETAAIVYENDHRTVTTEAGAIFVGGPESTRLYRQPPIHAAASSDEPLLVGLAAVDADVPSLSSSDRGTRLSVTTTVEHDRQQLDEQEYRLAIETTHPEAWQRYFDDVPTTTVDRDDRTVVVAAFSGDRPAYLVTHRTELEVAIG